MRWIARLLLLITGLCAVSTAWSFEQLAVRVTGLSDPLKKNVTLALKNEQSAMIQPIRIAGIRHFYKHAPKIIREALQPYGYFHPHIQSRLYRQKQRWAADFTIDPGTPVQITQIDLHIIGPAKNDHAFIRLYQHLPIKIGDTLNTEKYDKTKQLLYDLASTRGYFDSKMLKSKIYINLRTNQAKIVIHFRSGPRYFFGETRFSTNPFNSHFLRRFLRYRKGHYYNYHKIENTQENFANSNYFSQAIIKPLPKQATHGHVPIHIQLTPRKRYGITLGAGYGTDTGPRGTVAFDVRRVNQHGHRFKTLIQAAKNNSNASATYFIPGGNPATDVWSFSTGYADFDQVTGKGKSFKTEANYTTSLGKWKQTIALIYLDERYNLIDLPRTSANVLYPNIIWQYVSTRHVLHPKHGFSLSGSLAGTPKMGLSKISFAQGRIDAKFLMTFFHTTRLILRGSVARTEIKDVQNLPFSLQLFAGGARSVRGYSYNQIGPGRNLFVGSIELQQKIVGHWYLVGFYDVGNVTNNNAFSHLNEGAGPGIAWHSPVGVLAITVANAFTQPNKPWVIQFTMGPEL